MHLLLVVKIYLLDRGVAYNIIQPSSSMVAVFDQSNKVQCDTHYRGPGTTARLVLSVMSQLNRLVQMRKRGLDELSRRYVQYK